MRIAGESPRHETLPVEPAAPHAGRVPESAGHGSFGRVLGRLGSAVDRGEALIARAAHGNLGGLDSAQLIALQAGIYRYSEAVDLLAKLVDRASNAVRSVISPH